MPAPLAGTMPVTGAAETDARLVQRRLPGGWRDRGAGPLVWCNGRPGSLGRPADSRDIRL